MSKFNLISVGQTGLVDIQPFRSYKRIADYLGMHPTTVSRAHKEAKPMLSKTDPLVAYYVEKPATATASEDATESTSTST